MLVLTIFLWRIVDKFERSSERGLPYSGGTALAAMLWLGRQDINLSDSMRKIGELLNNK